jgi:modulator of FtsH protease HflK
MAEHPHPHDEGTGRPPELERPVDAGSQALAEALRSSFGIVKFVMVLLLLLFILSGVFVVGPQERAIVLRLGKPVGAGEKALLLPGLQWSFPYPIDDHVKVSISGLQKVTSTVGWFATTPEQELAGTEPPAGPTLNPSIDGYALTADNNIIHTRATLTYFIQDPVRYVFNFVSASNAVQSAVDNALLYSASHFNVDDILSRDVAGFQEAVRKRATELVEKQDLGIVVEQLTVQSIPPRQLKDAFANVLKAEVNSKKVLNEAHSKENEILSKANADAESVVNNAKSDRVRYVNETASQAKRFQDLLPKYRENPSLFVQKHLTETLGRVFTNAQDKIFVSEGADGNSKEVRLLLNRELPKPSSEEAKP